MKKGSFLRQILAITVLFNIPVAHADPELDKLLGQMYSKISAAVDQRVAFLSRDETKDESKADFKRPDVSHGVASRWQNQIVNGRLQGLSDSLFHNISISQLEKTQILTDFLSDQITTYLRMDPRFTGGEIERILAPLRNSEILEKDEIVDSTEIGKRIGNLVDAAKRDISRKLKSEVNEICERASMRSSFADHYAKLDSINDALRSVYLGSDVKVAAKRGLEEVYDFDFETPGTEMIRSTRAGLVRDLGAPNDEAFRSAIDEGLFRKISGDAENARIAEELRERELEEKRQREILERQRRENDRRLRALEQEAATRDMLRIREEFRTEVGTFMQFARESIKERISKLSQVPEEMDLLRAASDLPKDVFTGEHLDLLTFSDREQLIEILTWELYRSNPEWISEEEIDEIMVKSRLPRETAEPILILDMLDRIHDYCVLNHRISPLNLFFKKDLPSIIAKKLKDYRGNPNLVKTGIDNLILEKLGELQASSSGNSKKTEQETKSEELKEETPAPSAFEERVEDLVTRDRSSSVDLLTGLDGDIDVAMNGLLDAYVAETEGGGKVKDESGWLSGLFKKNSQKAGWLQAGQKVEALLKKFRQKINEKRVQQHIFGQLDSKDPFVEKVQQDWNTPGQARVIGKAFKDGDSVLSVAEAKIIHIKLVEKQHSDALKSFESILRESVQTGAIVPKKSGLLSFLKFTNGFTSADRAGKEAKTAEEAVLKEKTQAMVNSAMLKYEIDKMAGAGQRDNSFALEDLLLEKLGYKTPTAQSGSGEEKEAREREARATRNQAQANILREMLKVLMDEDGLGKQSVDSLEEGMSNSKMEARLKTSNVPGPAIKVVKVILKALEEMRKTVKEAVEPQKARIEDLPNDFPKLQKKRLLKFKSRWMDEEVERAFRDKMGSISGDLKELLRRYSTSKKLERADEDAIATKVDSLMEGWDSKFLDGSYSRHLDSDSLFRKRREFFEANGQYLKEEMIQGLDNNETLRFEGVCFGVSNTWAKEDLEKATDVESKRNSDRDTEAARRNRDQRVVEATNESRSGGVNLIHRIKHVVFQVSRSSRFSDKENWSENKSDPGKPYRDNFYKKDVREKYGFKDVFTPVTTNLSKDKRVTPAEYRETFVRDLLKVASEGQRHGVFVVEFRDDNSAHVIEVVLRENESIFQLSDPNIGRFTFPSREAFVAAFLKIVEIWYPKYYRGLAYQFELAEKKPPSARSNGASNARVRPIN